MDRIFRIPVAGGGVEYNVNRAGLVLFGIGGSQFPDDCFLDDVGFVPLHGWQSNWVEVGLTADIRLQYESSMPDGPASGSAVLFGLVWITVKMMFLYVRGR